MLNYQRVYQENGTLMSFENNWSIMGYIYIYTYIYNCMQGGAPQLLDPTNYRYNISTISPS